MIVEEASTSRTAVRGARLLMAAAIVVATAAGIVGAIMLVAPTSTGTYFAWPLGPPGLAALVGGFYVVSAPVFAYAGTLAHERIETTVPKAKELRPYVERLITIAKRGVKANDPKGVSLSARRLVMRDVLNETVVTKLFDELAPRFMERPGGYTRILKLGPRRSDATEMVYLELV
jgi:large subunit ribosomal protein L17